MSSSNLLKNINPKIFAQLHSTLNGGIDLNKLTNSSTKKIWWICEFCKRNFETTVSSRTRGSNHQKCSYKNKSITIIKYTTESFIERLKEIHVEKFDYSETVFISRTINTTVICNICKFKINIPAFNFLFLNKKCSECIKKAGPPLGFSQEEFLQKVIEKHGAERFIYDKIVYTGMSEKIEVFCKNCDKYFLTIADKFLKSTLGCKSCIHKGYSILYTKTQEKFLEECSLLERFNEIDFSKVIYEGTSDKIILICKIHNWEYYQTPHNLLHNSNGCVHCVNDKTESFPSRYCRKYLTSKNIDFQCEKKLPILPNRRYDFMFEYNGKKWIVEIDGAQHFRFTPKWHVTETNFMMIRNIDIQKNYGAIASGYIMIRISKTNYKGISERLEKVLENKNIGNVNFFYDNKEKYQHML